METEIKSDVIEEVQSFSVAELIRHTRWTWKYCRMMDRSFALAFFVFNLLSNIKGIASTLVYGFMINAISQFSTLGFNSVSAWQAFGVYSGYHLAEGFLEMFQQGFVANKKREIEMQLKRAFLHKLARLDLDKLDKSVDREKISEEYLNSTSVFAHYSKSIAFLSDVIAAAALLLIIAYFAWPLALLIFAVAVPRFWIDKGLRKKYAGAQKKAAPIGKGLKQITAVWLDRSSLRMAIVQKVTGLLDAKYVGAQKLWRQTVGVSYDRWQSVNRVLDMVNGLISVMGFAWVLFKNSQLAKIGYVYVQLQMIRLLQAKLKQLVVNYNALEESCGKLVSVQKAFGWSEVNPESQGVHPEIGSIELTGVRFGNLTAADPDSPGLDMKFTEGDKTDLIVYEPITAEMLARVISGMKKPMSGQVMIGGGRLETIPDGMSLSIPGAYFASLSVKENISLGANWEDDRAMQILETAGLTKIVAMMPKKSDQVLAEIPEVVNSDLIGRILLARVLYTKPKWVVWMSPLKISSRAESEIFAVLYKHVPSVISITDKVSSSKPAGRVVLIRRGKIIEDGSPASLISRGGEYARAMERLQAAAATATVQVKTPELNPAGNPAENKAQE